MAYILSPEGSYYNPGSPIWQGGKQLSGCDGAGYYSITHRSQAPGVEMTQASMKVRAGEDRVPGEELGQRMIGGAGGSWRAGRGSRQALALPSLVNCQHDEGSDERHCTFL